MPPTRATKQETVLEHISSLLPDANDLVVSISEIVVDPQVDDQVLNDSLQGNARRFIYDSQRSERILF